MRTAKQIALAAADRIAAPGAFTQHTLARTKTGELAWYAHDGDVASWCAVGAIWRETYDEVTATMKADPNHAVGWDWRAQVEEDIRAAARAVTPEAGELSYYNDTHTQAEVVALLRAAAERLA